MFFMTRTPMLRGAVSAVEEEVTKQTTGATMLRVAAWAVEGAATMREGKAAKAK
jgi:hypothetical protein